MAVSTRRFTSPKGMRPMAFAAFVGLACMGDQALAQPRAAPKPEPSEVENRTWVTGDGLCAVGIGSALALPDTRQHLFGKIKPKVYRFAIPFDLACCLATLAISVPHLRSLQAVDPKPDLQERKRSILVVARVPVLISVLKTSAVLMPRTWRLFFLFSAFYEVFAFWNFLRLINNMIGGTDGWTTASVTRAVQIHGPSRMWASPPLGCFFRCAMRAREVQGSDLETVRNLVLQFIFVMPFVSFVCLFGSLESLEPALAKVETLSLILAMQGLFALLEASEESLEGQRSHAKFWTIKATFIASTVAQRICTGVVTEDQMFGDLCYSSAAIASAWAGTSTALLAVPLAVLSRYAYPVEDLSPDGHLHSVSDVGSGSDSDEDKKKERMKSMSIQE